MFGNCCRILLVVTLLVGMGHANAESEVAKPTKKRTILVAPFENLSQTKSMIVYEVATNNNPDDPKRSFRVDRYTEAPRAILEDILMKVDGLVVVERQRVDALLLEAEFGSLSGLVDSEKAVKLGKMLGADIIIIGSILDVRTTEKNFRGYGIRTRQTIVSSSVRVRAIDIASGQGTNSRIFKGSETFSASQFGGTTDSDVAYAVIESALSKAAEDDAFLAELSGKKVEGVAKNVTVIFDPTPANADIEVDGLYMGGSPQTLSLPAGKPVKVVIRKAGYAPWESSVLPRDGLKVSPELASSGQSQ